MVGLFTVCALVMFMAKNDSLETLIRWTHLQSRADCPHAFVFAHTHTHKISGPHFSFFILNGSVLSFYCSIKHFVTHLFN